MAQNIEILRQDSTTTGEIVGLNLNQFIGEKKWAKNE